MKLYFIALSLSLMLVSSYSAQAETFINEMKIGIYAKDFKKIYENLDLQLSKDKNNTNPDKWVEVADMLVDIKDYSSAWQFYMHAVISLYQNETFSKREKSDKFSEIISKAELINKKASPQDLAAISKTKYSIYPAQSNVIASLSRMLEKSESKVFNLNSHPALSKSESISATADGKPSNETSLNVIQVNAAPIADEAPYYDYNEIIANISYPKRAYMEGLEGTVLLCLTIDEKGNIAEKSVRTSTNEIFNDNALKTIEAVKFIPAKRLGLPIVSSILVPVHFSNK